VVLDGLADVGDGAPGSHRLDAALHGLAGHPHQPARLLVDLADEERGIGVAVDALAEHGDVEVDDVAVAQRPGRRGCRGR
jgi:hypothetical protein